jgi:hypothetical protein
VNLYGFVGNDGVNRLDYLGKQGIPGADIEIPDIGGQIDGLSEDFGEGFNDPPPAKPPANPANPANPNPIQAPIGMGWESISFASGGLIRDKKCLICCTLILIKINPADYECREALATYRKFGLNSRMSAVGFGAGRTNVEAAANADRRAGDQIPLLDPPHCYDILNKRVVNQGAFLVPMPFPNDSV